MSPGESARDHDQRGDAQQPGGDDVPGALSVQAGAGLSGGAVRPALPDRVAPTGTQERRRGTQSTARNQDARRVAQPDAGHGGHATRPPFFVAAPDVERDPEPLEMERRPPRGSGDTAHDGDPRRGCARRERGTWACRLSRAEKDVVRLGAERDHGEPRDGVRADTSKSLELDGHRRSPRAEDRPEALEGATVDGDEPRAVPEKPGQPELRPRRDDQGGPDAQAIRTGDIQGVEPRRRFTRCRSAVIG